MHFYNVFVSFFSWQCFFHLLTERISQRLIYSAKEGGVLYCLSVLLYRDRYSIGNCNGLLMAVNVMMIKLFIFNRRIFKHDPLKAMQPKRLPLFVLLLMVLSSCTTVSNSEYEYYNERHAQVDSLYDHAPQANKGLLVASITREISALGKRGIVAFFFVRNKETGIEFEMSSNPDNANITDYGINNRSLGYKAIVDATSIDASSIDALNIHKDASKISVANNHSDNQAPFALASEISGITNQVGRVLAFELEPGMYEISKWKVITSGGTDFADFDADGRTPIAFEVKSGEVSYLCNCHITFDIGENIFGDAVEHGAEASIFDEMQRDMQYVDEKYPSLGDLKVNNIAANLRVIEHPLSP